MNQKHQFLSRLGRDIAFPNFLGGIRKHFNNCHFMSSALGVGLSKSYGQISEWMGKWQCHVRFPKRGEQENSPIFAATVVERD